MRKQYHIDENTELLSAQLAANQLERIGQVTCNATGDFVYLDAEVVHFETLIAHWLDQDDDYQEELRKIHERYDIPDDDIPEGIHRDTWHRQKRQAELRAMVMSAQRTGVFAKKGIHVSPDPL